MNPYLRRASYLLLLLAVASCGEPKFKKLKSGIEYKIFRKGSSSKKATVGSMITMNLKTILRDSVIFDSYKMNNNMPVPAQITKPAFNGDIMEGLAMMHEGDSAVFKILADSLFGSRPMPEFLKKGDMMQFIVKMVSVKTEAEYQKDQQEAAGKQTAADEKTIQDYLASKHLQAQKTPSGIYYVIEKTGNGKHPVASDKVKVHYKGTLLDGTTFDSSYDRGEPAEFPLTQVIRGWTEGIPMLDEGGKGILVIPSALAYGQNPPPGSPIKPNAVLVFEVELIAITTGK